MFLEAAAFEVQMKSTARPLSTHLPADQIVHSLQKSLHLIIRPEEFTVVRCAPLLTVPQPCEELHVGVNVHGAEAI